MLICEEGDGSTGPRRGALPNVQTRGKYVAGGNSVSMCRGVRLRQRQSREVTMHPLNRHSLCTLLLTGSVMLAVAPAIAADVTAERLANADKEPQNWLMNHRTYDAQRFSPLGRINRDNVKSLNPRDADPLAGPRRGIIEARHPAQAGVLYITDSSGAVQ